MTHTHAEIRRPYVLEKAPPLPAQFVSMMFASERDILYSIAKHYYQNLGDIIDAGIFLGASTYCFAKGLAENPRYSGEFHIHSYERAIVTPAMARSGSEGLALGPTGSDYSDYLRTLIAPLGDAVRLHCGDIREERYSGNVEVLFLDILKTRTIFQKCNHMFMGSLIPKHSLVIQQDYFWHLDWYINAYMELLSEYFIIVDMAETSCVFLNVKAIPRELTEGDPLIGLKGAEIVRLLQQSRNRSSTLFQYMMSELCIVDYAIKAGLAGLATNKLTEFRSQFGKVLSNLKNDRSTKRVIAACAALSKRVASTREEEHEAAIEFPPRRIWDQGAL